MQQSTACLHFRGVQRRCAWAVGRLGVAACLACVAAAVDRQARQSCLDWCGSENWPPDKCVLRRSASSGLTASPDTLRHRPGTERTGRLSSRCHTRHDKTVLSVSYLEAANGLTTVTSQTNERPPCHGIKVSKSGRLPSCLSSPEGSLTAGIPAAPKARQMTSLNMVSCDFAGCLLADHCVKTLGSDSCVERTNWAPASYLQLLALPRRRGVSHS